MKKTTTRKKMPKQRNSVSENFIIRLRHSRKSQMASILVLAVGLIGIYLVFAAFSPTNYGENLDRQALKSRGDSVRERVSLRVSDTFNRLNFVISREKDNPEWIQPVLLPAPAENVQKSLPDPTIFGSAEEQFIASLPEEQQEVVTTAPTPAQPTDVEPSDNSDATANNQTTTQELQANEEDPSGDSDYYKSSDEFCYYVNENAL